MSKKNRRTSAYSSPQLADVVGKNIEAILRSREEAERKKTFSDHLADKMTIASGSMWFAYLHVAWFTIWIAWNLAAHDSYAFDPYPFGLLTMIVSLEAIFLSTFVLVSQNQQAKLGDRRSDLDLQIDLLAEHEITRILCVVDAIAKHLKIEGACGIAASAFERDVEPDQLLNEIERREEETRKNGREKSVRPS